MKKERYLGEMIQEKMKFLTKDFYLIVTIEKEDDGSWTCYINQSKIGKSFTDCLKAECNLTSIEEARNKGIEFVTDNFILVEKEE